MNNKGNQLPRLLRRGYKYCKNRALAQKSLYSFWAKAHLVFVLQPPT